MNWKQKIVKVATSAQVVFLAVLLTVLVLIQAFYPEFSWFQMAIGSVVIIILVVIVLLAGFKNDENIIGN